MYRGDWAKEAGLENGVHSWEDLGVYFQWIKDNKEGVYPWDVLTAAAPLTLRSCLAAGRPPIPATSLSKACR